MHLTWWTGYRRLGFMGLVATGLLSSCLIWSKMSQPNLPRLDFVVQYIFYIKPPIDRVILVGIVHQGKVAVGDEVVVHCQSGNVSAKVETIEAFDKQLTVASAGDQVGLRLIGITKDQPSEGDQVTAK
jgi:sulfate adenylyltransferase subunit 1 (EFTu-like GTPase family)